MFLHRFSLTSLDEIPKKQRGHDEAHQESNLFACFAQVLTREFSKKVFTRSLMIVLDCGYLTCL